jgi:hypothetical protein
MAAITVRLLRIASVVICLIVAASFLVFAVQQTKGASNQQSEQLNSEVPGAQPTAPAPAHRESSVHKTLDEASGKLTSPFNSVISPSAGQWADRGVKLLLALVVYGFGLGYIVRFLSVRS